MCLRHSADNDNYTLMYTRLPLCPLHAAAPSVHPRQTQKVDTMLAQRRRQ